jgi:hypothetical protein
MTETDEPYQFVAYIDEAGDPGLKRVRPIDENGASEWLVLGAVVVRAGHKSEMIDWVREMRSNLGVKQRPDLHYRKLSPTRKLSLCNQIAAKNLRAFAILSNKKNMRRYYNPNAEKRGGQQWFYNFCNRLLLERITDYCLRRSIKEKGTPGKVKIIFSERGGLRYSQTQAYIELLRTQSRAKTLYLKKRDIKWEVLDYRLLEARPHDTVAGLQLADVVASAFYQAVDFLGPGTWDTRFAEALEPRIAREGSIVRDYGVALQPTPPSKGELTPEQKKIFQFYGYHF